MTDKDLDLSGFQTDRKVDVPPPPKKTSPVAARQKPERNKGKKGKKKRKADDIKPKSLVPKVEEEAKESEPPEPSKPPSPVPVARIPRQGRKKRVNVSIPVELSQRFTERANEEDRYLTDMVLDAYRNHFAKLRDEYEAERGDLDLPYRPRRRKAATGRVTHMLYLAAPEAAVIDGSAVEIGLTRSELVSQLLELELG